MNNKPVVNKGIKILGIGQSLPNKVLTYKELESILYGSSTSWIENKLGIQERRISIDDTNGENWGLGNKVVKINN